MDTVERADHSSVLVQNGASHDDSRGVQSVTLENFSDTTSFDASSSLFWITIWSIVLQQYTEADLLLVALHTASESRTFEKSAYSVSITPESNIDDITNNNHNEIQLIPVEDKESKYNTGLVISDKAAPCDLEGLINTGEASGNVSNCLFLLSLHFQC